MKVKVLVSFLILVSGFVFSITIAVYGFESAVFNESIVAGYTRILESALFDTGFFDIVDRLSLEKVLSEHKLEASGIVQNISKAVELGRLAGADYIVVGSVDQTPSGYVVSVKIIDVTTAKLAFSHSESITSITDVDSTIRSIVQMIAVKDGKIVKVKTHEVGTTEETAVIPQAEIKPAVRQRFFIGMDALPMVETTTDYYGYTTSQVSIVPLIKFGTAEFSGGKIISFKGYNLGLGLSNRRYSKIAGMNLYFEYGSVLFVVPYFEVGISFGKENFFADLGLFWFALPYLGLYLSF